jgi:hypothetical protein
VPTAAYNEALRSKHSIFVGRKGTGKTASLYKLSEELRADPRNHICIVKPVDYELAGLMAMLAQQLAVADQGYLIESFWKFLLFTELARSVYEGVLGKPSYYERTDPEVQLCAFVEQYQSIIMPEFSLRLEAAVRRVGDLPSQSNSEAQRSAISERLHTEMLARLRSLLGNTLHSKGKVAILIDNLDKSWDHHTDLELLSDLLFGLLSVSTSVAQEFGREKRGAVNLYLTIFLRSDIHAAMIKYARERDKLPVRRISWNDPELLRRVIEERFVRSGADVTKPEEIWTRYFPPSVQNISMRDYLASSVIPRPRDLIFLVKASLEFAVNRGHGRIEEADLISAQQQYSHFALNSILAEAKPRIAQVDDLLLEFAGGPEIVDGERIVVAMRKAGISETRVAEIVGLLTELTFLGPETSPGHFEFIYDEDSLMKTEVMARNLSERSGNPIRYRVNPPFDAFLEITPKGKLIFAQLQMDLSATE